MFSINLKNIKFDYRYAFEGILQAVYLDRPNLACLEIYCHMRTPNKILSTMNMPTVPFYIIVIILGSWILCLHIITYALFYWRIYYARKWRVKWILVSNKKSILKVREIRVSKCKRLCKFFISKYITCSIITT